MRTVTDLEKVEMVEVMTKGFDRALIHAYLGIAGSKICRKAYPYHSQKTTVPEEYDYLQVEIAVYLLNKRGAEGEISYSDGATTRTYENGDVPDSMLRNVIPYAAVFSGEG